jgi:hypothetical protein
MHRRPPSPWSQPLAWLVIALPAIAVGVGMALSSLSGGLPGAMHARTALAQAADFEAQRRGLSAHVRRAGETLDIVPLAEGFDRNVPLELVLHHPMLATQDLRVALTPTRDGWRGRLAAFDASHDWILELAPTDRRWRLLGQWPARVPDTALRPAASVMSVGGGVSPSAAPSALAR